MEWVVMQKMPLAEVDNGITHKGMRYGAIASELLRKMIFLLQSEVKTKIKEQLPNQLVLVFDGWTEGNEHFIGIHASYIDPISNLASKTLLSMQPLLAEGVKTMSVISPRLLRTMGRQWTTLFAFLLETTAQIIKAWQEFLEFLCWGVARTSLT
jgi:hypothetical protein